MPKSRILGSELEAKSAKEFIEEIEAQNYVYKYGQVHSKLRREIRRERNNARAPLREFQFDDEIYQKFVVEQMIFGYKSTQRITEHVMYDSRSFDRSARYDIIVPSVSGQVSFLLSEEVIAVPLLKFKRQEMPSSFSVRDASGADVYVMAHDETIRLLASLGLSLIERIKAWGLTAEVEVLKEQLALACVGSSHYWGKSLRFDEGEIVDQLEEMFYAFLSVIHEFNIIFVLVAAAGAQSLTCNISSPVTVIEKDSDLSSNLNLFARHFNMPVPNAQLAQSYHLIIEAPEGYEIAKTSFYDSDTHEEYVLPPSDDLYSQKGSHFSTCLVGSGKMSHLYTRSFYGKTGKPTLGVCLADGAAQSHGRTVLLSLISFLVVVIVGESSRQILVSARGIENNLLGGIDPAAILLALPALIVTWTEYRREKIHGGQSWIFTHYTTGMLLFGTLILHLCQLRNIQPWQIAGVSEVKRVWIFMYLSAAANAIITFILWIVPHYRLRVLQRERAS